MYLFFFSDQDILYICFQKMQADWKHSIASELYDHDDDPSETRNLAMDKDYQKIRSHLSLVLYQHFNNNLYE